jgi:hypothetical protein
MLHRSGKARGRVSEKTLKLVARRTNLRGAFEKEVKDWLDYYAVWLLPLDRGGWALVAKSALEGAPPITAMNFIKAELKALNDNTLDEAAVIDELGFQSVETEE